MRKSDHKCCIRAMLLGLLVCCALVVDLQAAETTQPADDKAAILDLLKNLSYGGIYEQPVQLTNGRYEGEPFVPDGASRPTVSLVEELQIFGDLDGDGSKDAAVLLTERSGGSGSFVYLAAVYLKDGQATNLATTLLGDRVQIKRMDYTNGAIRLEMFVPEEGDASLFPTRKIGATYRVLEGKLVEIRAETLGTLNVAELAGTSWVLKKMVAADSEQSPEGTITLAFQEGRVAGLAACNRYSAEFEGQNGGLITIGMAMATQMACPEPLMTEERQFLELLGKIERFGFRFSNLVLSASDGLLIFTPHQD